MNPEYRIVASMVKEFDYPKGNDNVYTGYSGHGGVPLDTLWKRLLFAGTPGIPRLPADKIVTVPYGKPS
jgi:uncharacterized membrane protein (UPF0182 family)